MFTNVVHTSTFCHELQEVLNYFIDAGVNVKVDISISTGEQREEELSLEYNCSYGQDKFEIKHTISNDIWLSTYKKSSLDGKFSDLLRMGYEPEVEVTISDLFIGSDKLRLEYSSNINTWKVVGNLVREPVVRELGSLEYENEVKGPGLCKKEFLKILVETKKEKERSDKVDSILQNIAKEVEKLEDLDVPKSVILKTIREL